MTSRFDPNQLWRFKEDIETSFTWENMLLKNDKFGIENEEEMEDRYIEIIRGLHVNSHDSVPLPGGFPAPILNFPSSGFAPDYFSFGSTYFCSARLRMALAQPPKIIEYSPVDLRCGGTAAIAQEYQRMRIIACQPAMDLQRSFYDSEESIDLETGEVSVSVQSIDKMVLHAGFEPKTEIFRVAEDSLNVLATDALAHRVLQAGCTGLEFCHLETPDFTIGYPVMIRTKRGISLRKRRSTPRTVS
jgi:hypothetical protein